MLVLNPRRVAEELRNGTLRESQKAGIVIAAMIFGSIWGRGSVLDVRSWGDLLFTGVYLGASLGGFWSCYRLNAAGDDRQFIERYVCVGVPVMIWTYGLYLLVFYATYFTLRTRPGYDAESFTATTHPYFLLLGLAALGTFFWIVRRFLRRISTVPLAG